MSYHLVILPSAKRELSSLPRDIQQRIDKSILTLAENPHPRPPAIIAMKGKQKGLFGCALVTTA